VRFLLERGADPKFENKCGRTPLELAEHLAQRNSEELERQAIAHFLRHWDPEQHEVDDGTIVKTAREIWGLNGGGKAKLAKKAIQSFCKSHPKTTAIFKSGAAGAGTGAAIQGIQEGVSCCRGKREDGSLQRIREQAKAGACEGIVGDAARHGVQKIAGKLSGTVAEGTAIGVTRCAMDNSGSIIQDLWGIAGGIAGTAIGAAKGHPVKGGILGEVVGEGFGKILENEGEWIGEKVSDMLFSKKMEEVKKPAVKQEASCGGQGVKPPKESSSTSEKSSDTNEEEDPEMKYYCRHCSANFWRRRSREIRCGSEYKNTCPRCGRLGSRATLLSSFGGHSLRESSIGGSFGSGGYSVSLPIEDPNEPKMWYKCQHCNENFGGCLSREIRCGSDYKNTCPRCGRLGSRTS
jgi:hypothetical protein